MGGIGLQELMVIGVIVMLIFGPRQLPKLGKALGETIKEFRSVRKELNEVTDELEGEVDGIKRDVADVVKPL